MSLALTKAAVQAAAIHGQVECPVTHEFADGLYTRRLFIPAGTLVIGKVHTRQTMNICAMGDISILTTKGAKRFKAGDVVVSAPGIQKVGYAHEDTVWVNVWATHETDVNRLEALLATDPITSIEAREFLALAGVQQ